MTLICDRILRFCSGVKSLVGSAARANSRSAFVQNSWPPTFVSCSTLCLSVANNPHDFRQKQSRGYDGGTSDQTYDDRRFQCELPDSSLRRELQPPTRIRTDVDIHKLNIPRKIARESCFFRLSHISINPQHKLLF